MLRFNLERMGAPLGGWTKKDRTAAEYTSAGSDYRTYKPTLSDPPGGGLFTTTKIDHIRGWAKDDHNQLEVEFDPYGQLVSVRSVMTIQGTPQFDTGLVKAAATLYDDRAAQIAEVAAKIVNSLTIFVTDLNEHGGRANFPAIVRHNLNLISASVEPVGAPPSLSEQDNWRWCRKCQGLAFGGAGAPGACPAGGIHDHTGSGNYTLVHDAPGASGQSNWRWCRTCQGLAFGGAGAPGACPAGGTHDHTGSGDYSLRL